MKMFETKSIKIVRKQPKESKTDTVTFSAFNERDTSFRFIEKLWKNSINGADTSEAESEDEAEEEEHEDTRTKSNGSVGTVTTKEL